MFEIRFKNIYVYCTPTIFPFTSPKIKKINVSSNATSCDLLNEVFSMKTNVKYIFI